MSFKQNFIEKVVHSVQSEEKVTTGESEATLLYGENIRTETYSHFVQKLAQWKSDRHLVKYK